MATKNNVRTRFRRVADRWIKLGNQLEQAIYDREICVGETRKRLTKKIQRLRPLVNKAWKLSEKAYSDYCQAA